MLTMWHEKLPQPGIESMVPAVEGRSLNHWTARAVPVLPNLYQAIEHYPRSSLMLLPS